MLPAGSISGRALAALTLSLAACTTGGWAPLLTPGSLDGWQTLPGGHWAWVGDELVGTSEKSEKRHGLLISEARYHDFEARFEFRVVTGNSGFYFRVDRVGGEVGVAGFQAEVDQTMNTGGLYETRGRGWVVQPDPERMKAIYRPGEWTRMQVTAVGGGVEVRVNGEITASLERDPGRRSGHFALQLHGGQDLRVEFRKLRVREIEQTR